MSTDGALYDQVQEAVSAVRKESSLVPYLAIVLGSGLGPLADEVTSEVSVPYSQIPHFPVSGAPGHAGKLVLGKLEGQPVSVMAGRVHMYEGYSAQQVAFPIQVMRDLGARALIVTNAAGGINPSFHPGLLMLIADHINLTGRNPLVGTNEARHGLRFPDLSNAYSLRLRELARQVALEVEVPVSEGVYAGLLGPSYETPAEIRMLRMLGSDAVGMSTVMEVIAANHRGIEVLGISCITNMAAGMLPQPLTEEEVMATAARVRHEFSSLVRAIVRRLGSAAR